MTALVLDTTARAQIRDLREFAALQPVNVLDLGESIKTPEGKAQHVAKMTRQTIKIPLAYVVTYSVESGHPCGTCRHMSMSVDRVGRVPTMQALWMVAQQFGFSGGPDTCAVWPEKLLGHGVALNLVQPIRLGEPVP